MHEMKVYTKAVQFWIFCQKRVGQSVRWIMAISHPSMGRLWILVIDLKKSFVPFYTNPGHFLQLESLANFRHMTLAEFIHWILSCLS